MKNSSTQKRFRFSIGLSGVNFLKAAIWAFREEERIHIEHYTRFPDREFGLKSRKASGILSDATKKTILLIKDLEKNLKF